MCGIVGYVGDHQAASLLLDGLTQLEYRGYDSAGIAVLGGRSGLKRVRSAGRVRDLAHAVPKRFNGNLGIGHTRWATHGAPIERNAHPHVDASERVAVVHNGILDNAASLRARLEGAGVELASDTDSEVLAHLVARSDATTLEGKVLDALAGVDGTYGIAVMHADFADRLVVARHGSPIVIGLGDKQTHVASDVAALVQHTSHVVHLDDGEMATLTSEGFTTFTADRVVVDKEPTRVSTETGDYAQGDYDHFMLKEILDQPDAIERALRGRLDARFGTSHLGGLNLDPREARGITRVKVLACGSAYYVGQMGAHMIEELARIPADAEPASEFRYRNPVIEPDTLYIAVSQSGETADTLLAVQEVQRKGGRVAGFVNVVGSTIARQCGSGIYLHAGPEVSVASTKALTNMGVAFALLALHLGRVRDLSIRDGQRLVQALERLSAQVEAIVADTSAVEAAAEVITDASSLFFVGRVRGYPVAREGAQKLKEISYIHAEAYQASELKHGPLALIEPSRPTIAIVPGDELAGRNVAALHEIQARDGHVVVVTHADVDLSGLEQSRLTRLDVPRSEPELDPLLLVIPLQLLAYAAAVRLGRDVDRPRNLAKSVTVE